jgi:hypothetical protein
MIIKLQLSQGQEGKVLKAEMSMTMTMMTMILSE